MAKKIKNLPSAKKNNTPMVEVLEGMTSEGDVYFTTKDGVYIAGYSPKYHEWIRFEGTGFETITDEKEKLKHYLKDKILR